MSHGEPRAASQPAGEVTLVGPDGGAALAGARYRLSRELGRGATGVVYLARDAALARDVALKLLHPGTGMAARGRFFAEARVAAALRHPDIVAIFDVDEIHRFIVMECCRGGTLATRLRGGSLGPAEALAHHVEILSALAAAHRRGVVHRDLKPANLLYRHDPARDATEIVVADFGAAHLAATAKDGEGPVGTLRYMAPEQRRGEDSPAVDVYAAAVILAEMLGGRTDSTAVAAPAPTLDDTVAGSLPPALATDLAAHLAALAATDPSARPTAADALVAARGLHDRLRIARASA
jgi:serine/threonine protein kinase